MPRRLRIGLLCLLVPVLLALFLGSPMGQHLLLRPLVEQFLSHKVGGDVSMGRFRLWFDQTEITQLVFELGPNKQVTIERLDAAWSWQRLQQNQLDALQLTRPLIEWKLGTTATKDASLPLPNIPVRELTLSEGELKLQWREHPLTIAGLNLTMAGDEQAPFRIEGTLGTEALPLVLEGTVIPGNPAQLDVQQIRLDQQELLEQSVQFELAPGQSLPSLNLSLDTLHSQDLQRLAAALDIRWPLQEDQAFFFDAPRILVHRGEPLHAQLAFKSAWGQLGDRRLDLGTSRVEVSREDRWRLTGDLTLPAQSKANVDLVWHDGQGQAQVDLFSPRPDALLRLMQPQWTQPLHGGVQAQVELDFTASKLIESRFDLQGRPGDREPSTPEAFDLTSARLEGRVRGMSLEELDGEAQLGLGKQAAAKVQGTFDQWDWELFPTSSTPWKALLPPQIWPEALTSFQGLQGKGSLAHSDRKWTGRGQLRLSDVAYGPAALEDAQADWVFDGAPDSWQLNLRKASGQLGGEGFPTGQLTLAGSLRGSPNQIRARISGFEAKELEYLNEDGTKGFGGGHISAKGVATLPRQGDWSLDFNGELGIREVLQGAFYAETGTWPGTWDLKGVWQPQRQNLKIRSAELAFPALGSSRFRGDIRRDRQALQGDFVLPKLEEAISPLLAQALEGVNPELATLEMSGAIRGKGGFDHQGERWTVKGSLIPQDLVLSWPHIGLWLETPSGTLPLALEYPPAEGPTVPGHLQIDQMRLGPLTMEKTRLPIKTHPNQWLFPEPQTWSLAGGQVALESLEFRAGGEPFQIFTDIDVISVQLERLTEEMGWPRMAGSLSADFGRLAYRNDSVQSEGTAEIRAFDGTMRFSGMRAQDLFGSYPGFEADINFNGLNLQALTQTLQFGEMNGIIDGYIRNLRLLGATPSRFDARVESRVDGSRTISVRALDNITVVSQGSSSSALSRGIYRFIPRYNYRKLGVQCRLVNDAFSIRGIARSGSNRHLVDGGFWPPKIDIVSPEATVSFKEMLRRLQRVNRSGG